MQPPEVLDENGHRLYRSSYRPGDTLVAPPYELHEDSPGLYSLHDPNLNFRVDKNVITILTSNASPGNKLPSPRSSKIGHMHRRHSRVVPFPEGDESRSNWLGVLGQLIAAVMFGKTKSSGLAVPFELSDFPKHMKFYLLEKTQTDLPRQRRVSVYLRESRGTTFESPFEFARHAMWLMDGKPERDGLHACLCIEEGPAKYLCSSWCST
ncbi:unnamed protein product [Peniophora sp. CBMAI 1063]|nr:unnamed protein product [Peniophora sp. CBMAI 1063]